MIYIKNSLATAYSFISKDICFLDFETTGLSKQNDTLMCIGVATLKDSHLLLEQWLIENNKEEIALLYTLMETLPQFNRIYTYGGKHFELPFLTTKLEAYNLGTSFLTNCHLVDLKPPKTKRTLLEAQAGFKRSQTSTGKELAKLAKLSLQAPNQAYHTLILEHNKEELLSLNAIFNYVQFLKHLSTSDFKESKLQEKSLVFLLNPSLTYSKSFDLICEHLECHYDCEQNTFQIQLEAQHLTLKTYLPSKDYYLVEGELMHKSLAKLLPASMRQKVTKEMCYLEQKGYYIPYILEECGRSWQDAHNIRYTLYDPNTFHPYTLSLLKQILKVLSKMNMTEPQ